MSKSKEFIPNITEYRILETIFLLNKDNYFPNNEGLYKILSGVEDTETSIFTSLSTYGTLVSYSSKKISRHVMMLRRYHYLTRKFDASTNKYYLAITNIGVTSLEEFKKKRKIPQRTKAVSSKNNIVKIED